MAGRGDEHERECGCEGPRCAAGAHMGVLRACAMVERAKAETEKVRGDHRERARTRQATARSRAPQVGGLARCVLGRRGREREGVVTGL